MTWKQATAAAADYGETAASEALAEARRRRAAPGYVSGAAIERKKLEAVVLDVDAAVRIRQSGIPETFWGITFTRVERGEEESFKAWKHRALCRNGFCVTPDFEAAYTWAESWEPHVAAGSSLFFSGQVGRGKSLLAAAIAQRLLSVPVALRYGTRNELGRVWVGVSRTGGSPVLWTSEKSLLRDERATQKFGRSTHASFAARAINVAVLVIDDFLSVDSKRNEAVIELLEWVIGERYNGRKPVILTSNSDHTKVEAIYGMRMADRIGEMISHHSQQVGGPSWRAV